MSSSPLAPRVFKAAIVQVAPIGGAVLRAVAMQYNPEKVSRTISAQTAGGGGGEARGEAMRLRGPASESIRMEALLDASDRLENPEQNALALRHGIAPELAALELFLHPPTAQLMLSELLASAGVLEVVPPEAPLLVLIWGPGRVVPVRLDELTIEEEFFDPQLNPIRARVTLSFRTLGLGELGTTHPGGMLQLAAMVRREAQALAASTSIAALGSLQGMLGGGS